MDKSESIVTVDDAIRKLILLNSKEKIWTQEMLLQVNDKSIRLLDCESQVPRALRELLAWGAVCALPILPGIAFSKEPKQGRITTKIHSWVCGGWLTLIQRAGRYGMIYPQLQIQILQVKDTLSCAPGQQ